MTAWPEVYAPNSTLYGYGASGMMRFDGNGHVREIDGRFNLKSNWR